MNTIAERIKFAMEVRKMRQVELVQKTGISKGAFSSYLSGNYNPKQDKLELIADCDAGGPTILKSTDSKHFFVLCHLEYDSDTLKLEYERDLAKGLNPEVPCNYFPDDDPARRPVVNWRSAGQLLFSNWLNYYVYQTTPYDIGNRFEGK